MPRSIWDATPATPPTRPEKSGKAEFDYHLTKAAPALCIDCHDVKDAALQKAHQDQPFATADCTSCHDPHQSAAPKLMRQFLHPPFADKSCDTVPCAGQGRQSGAHASRCEVALRDLPQRTGETDREGEGAASGSGRRLHRLPQSACQPAAGPAQDERGGHLPGAATPIRPSKPKSTFCISPRFKQGCATCHEPHGGENDHLLRAKNVNGLCLECHGPDSQPKKLESEHVLTIFNGSVKLPEDYFAKNKVVVLPLKYGRGTSGGRPPGLRCGRSDGHHQDEGADQLPVVPPAAFLGAARSADQGSGQQFGVLFQLSQRSDAEVVR